MQMHTPSDSVQEGRLNSRPHSPHSNAPPVFPVPTHSRGPSGSPSPPPSLTQGQGSGTHSAGRGFIGSIQQSYLPSNGPPGLQNAPSPPPYAPFVQPGPQNMQPRPHGAMQPALRAPLPTYNTLAVPQFDTTFAHDCEADVGNNADGKSLRKRRFAGPHMMDCCAW
ncbi:hypothetical protein EW145_g5302 [Phellinidium pouzarii]|uniref:Uncharacterized protein n=1 Tax=Phellinidium pouzarii TaxID=167371 RepID=A0A4S4L0M9_9AGAM|nr:hypothetical protein EW145_g5302 [Phellinidium pouzarii]